MSTSLVYHAFGAKTYRYLQTEYREGAIHLHIEKKDKHRWCTACRSRDITFDGNETSTVKTLPVGRSKVFLVLHLKMLVCRKCGARRFESRDVADPRKSYTRAFARFALDPLREMTMYAAAVFLGVGWDLVKEILRSNLQRRADRRSFRKVRRIAVDEIAIRRGQDCMTVVLDLDTCHVLYAAEGNDAKSLAPFFRRLRRAHAKLEAVAMDMSEACAKAVRESWKKPFCEALGVKVGAVLTDNGREFCGLKEKHPYELLLAMEEIEHRNTKPRSPRTTGFVERMNRTLLEKCFKVQGRQTWYIEPAEIQRDLDRFITYYNLERSHQGYRLRGRTPAQALREALGKEVLPPLIPADDLSENEAA